MLSKEFRLPTENFRKIKKYGKVISCKLFVVSYIKSESKYPRFGFVVGKFLDKKATKRNLVKRRLSEAVGSYIKDRFPNPKLSGFDLSVIARKPIESCDYAKISAEVDQLLSAIFKF